MNPPNRYRPYPTIWQAPLFAIAVMLTAGIAVDRYVAMSPQVIALACAAALMGLVTASCTGNQRAVLPCVATVAFLLGAGHHQWWQNSGSSDELNAICGEDPVLVRLRGVVREQPDMHQPYGAIELHSRPQTTSMSVPLELTALFEDENWRPLSGTVRMYFRGRAHGIWFGDEIEAVGLLKRPELPLNPGETNTAILLRDRGIDAVFEVRAGAKMIVRGRRVNIWELTYWRETIRSWAKSALDELLPQERQTIARALLLGEQNALQQEEWDRFQRTGVVHVLAISGQHLIILAWFLAVVFRVVHLSQRRAAVLLIVFLLAYAVVTGCRAPVMRATLMVSTVNIGLVLRRSPAPANTFALAWILLCVWNPTSVFQTGFQLSFLATLVILWGSGSLRGGEQDTALRLENENRSVLSKTIRQIAARLGALYIVSLLVWCSVTPLIAARYHLICPIGLLIGPPVMLLTSVALLCGFLMLLSAPLGYPLAALFAFPTNECLRACDWLVQVSLRCPGGYWYVPDVSQWWLWCFYLLVIGGLLLPSLRRRWLWVGIAMLGWLCLGLSFDLIRRPAPRLRCTFLAVGHGSCVVVETDCGRTILYDAGAMNGPGVTRKYIAPFLWHRGVRRIDEVFLSHADLDHFNGMVDLIERFAIGRISFSPTFVRRRHPGVRRVMAAIERAAIPVRVVRAGFQWKTGAVTWQVLHPPNSGPSGKENVRSLVMLLHHQDKSILLTGDLEKSGLAALLSKPKTPVDVLMAPHHGSRSANTDALADWSRPKFVISCQGKPRGARQRLNPYTRRGAVYLTTWEHGAVVVQSVESEIMIETFRSNERWRLK